MSAAADALLLQQQERRSYGCCGIPMKLVALGALTLQTVGMIFVLRLSRTEHVDGPRYLTTTAILLAEPLKMLVSVCMHFKNADSPSSAIAELNGNVIQNPKEMLKTSVPGLLYALQNNLLFIGLSGLTASTYQLTCQLKILTTAAMSILILGTRLTGSKWFALLVLTVGVVISNMAGHPNAHLPGAENPNTLVGLLSTIGATCTSALAGVYIEKLLKESNVSIWVRNIQFSFWGIIFSGIICLQQDSAKIGKDGFFQGYNALVCVVVVSHACGGMCVAMVLKYADNILKSFSGALAIVFSCSLSVFFFQEATADRYLISGVILVMTATNIYGLSSSTPTPSDVGTKAEKMPLLKDQPNVTSTSEKAEP